MYGGAKGLVMWYYHLDRPPEQRALAYDLCLGHPLGVGGLGQPGAQREGRASKPVSSGRSLFRSNKMRLASLLLYLY